MMTEVYIVEGQSIDTDVWSILNIFNNYPSAVKYAQTMEEDGWLVRVRSWKVND